MAHFEKRRFIVNGQPALVLAGEVHYFRLRRADWEDRVRKTKAAGCNALAAYIPWMFHEEQEGEIDLTGKSRPERDLGAFIDLCREHDLWFIARPGPFTMGEIKNEGLPSWIYRRCLGAIPTTWGGKPVTSKTLSYLDPEFLAQVARWYGAVMPILAPRLEPKGGNIISVQLDNEIGMLQCWTEEADLSEDVLCELAKYVQTKYSPEEIQRRYPFDLADPAARAKFLWDGTFPEARAYHADYTELTRDRFARYAMELRRMSEEHGVRDVPFVINIHGSGGGRATTFPIGISQTFRAYNQATEFWGSSDHYLGEITRQNVADLYFLNAFMASVNRPEQPLSSIEFEAGTGDYGETGAVRQSAAATDFKARISVIQGNRMLNHYLLAGGHNPELDRYQPDGNSRLGTTGGRHGFAAPIGPEGQLDATYHALSDTNHVLLAHQEFLAVAEEEHDPIRLAFLPDYYSTDVKRPGPMRELASQLESARGPLEGMVRNMLLSGGLSFTAINLQSDFTGGPAIALAAAPCLHREVQERLVEFVRAGGKLLLYGNLPTFDLEGNPCTVLADALQIQLQDVVSGSSDRFPSLVGRGWASLEPEVRVWQVLPFRAPAAAPFLDLLQTDLHVGAHIPVGRGEVTLVTTELPAHHSLWKGLFDRLGAKPGMTHDDRQRGTVLNRLVAPNGDRMVSLVNLDSEEKVLRISALPKPIFLPGRRAKLLPLGFSLEGMRLEWATTEVCRREPGRLAFRRSSETEFVRFAHPVRVVEGPAQVQEGGRLVQIAPGRGPVVISRA